SARVLLPEREATAVEIALNSLTREIKEREPFHREVARTELEKVLWLAHRFGRRPAGRPPAHPRLRKVIEYLDDNFADDLGLEELADRFALSAGHLSRTFKRYTGLGLKQYILQRRIVAAKRLLEEAPGLKVAAVSNRVGFHDFAVFNRDFKLITGLTPSAYRKNSYPAVKK
ncbi:MAG TPA: AraC family transcriptional regulator, partial [bacterium]|nr:AraC family transcriptional regulator [bacterium]